MPPYTKKIVDHNIYIFIERDLLMLNIDLALIVVRYRKRYIELKLTCELDIIFKLRLAKTTVLYFHK